MRGLRRINSGEERYLVNSEAQSASEKGGNEPVTGRHSVILRLRDDQNMDVEVA